MARFGDVHDVQFDSSCRYLATATEDHIVRIWETDGQKVVSELRGHRSPVSSLSWAQGAPNTMLASASTDGIVIVWREIGPGDWRTIHQIDLKNVVNDIAFCPPEYNLMLAAACGGGEVTVLTRRQINVSPVVPAAEQWPHKAFRAHPGGVIALSWAPGTSPAILATGPAAQRAAPRAPRRLVTVGATDRTACIWVYDEKSDAWTQLHKFHDEEQLSGVMRDVAWRPNVGIPSSVVATCTEGGVVAMWVQDMDGQPWRLQSSWQVGGDARRLAWSSAGTLLAVSVGEMDSLVYKEGPCGHWTQVTSLDQ